MAGEKDYKPKTKNSRLKGRSKKDSCERKPDCPHSTRSDSRRSSHSRSNRHHSSSRSRHEAHKHSCIKSHLYHHPLNHNGLNFIWDLKVHQLFTPTLYFLFKKYFLHSRPSISQDDSHKKLSKIMTKKP